MSEDNLHMRSGRKDVETFCSPISEAYLLKYHAPSNVSAAPWDLLTMMLESFSRIPASYNNSPQFLLQDDHVGIYKFLYLGYSLSGNEINELAGV